MDSPAEKSLFDRLVSPWAMFLGIAVAFLGCCLGGYRASRRNPFEHFERFHVHLGPETLFYPTACQVRQLARSRLDPAKIAVIVGGNSILQGFAQPRGEIWTRKLQALLGDGYQVINLALSGAQAPEFGAIAAEFLAQDYHKLILIANLPPAWVYPDPDGSLFKYFFWDAYSRGWLLPDKGRDRRLRALVKEAAEPTPGLHPILKVASKGEQQAELRAQMRLNRHCYFNDLWTTLVYTHCDTLWTHPCRACFPQARRLYPDPDPGPPPLARRYLLHPREDCLAQIRQMLQIEIDPAVRWPNFARVVDTCFPRPVRRRTLLLVLWHSPYYLRQLPPDEQACYTRVSRRTVRELEALGFPALAVGPGFDPIDYADFMHLTPSGGDKMAAAVAVQVRVLARQLGYTR